MAFRDRLLATIEAARSVLEEPDVLVIGSELRHTVRSNLTVLSLIEPRVGMPDPRTQRSSVAAVLRRLESIDGGTR